MVGIVVSVVIVMVVAFILTTIQNNQNTKAAECQQLAAQISQDKSSITQQLFNNNQVNQLIDQYNAQCAGSPTDYAGQ